MQHPDLCFLHLQLLGAVAEHVFNAYTPYARSPVGKKIASRLRCDDTLDVLSKSLDLVFDSASGKLVADAPPLFQSTPERR